MITIESLKNKGTDTETGLARCLGNETLYLHLVKTALDDKKFVKLGEALNTDNFTKAFELCHALKGVIGNLSITPLYEILSEITEKLRNKEADDYSKLYNEILKIRSDFSDS